MAHCVITEFKITSSPITYNKTNSSKYSNSIVMLIGMLSDPSAVATVVMVTDWLRGDGFWMMIEVGISLANRRFYRIKYFG